MTQYEPHPDTTAARQPITGESYGISLDTPLLTIIPDLGRLGLTAADGVVVLEPIVPRNCDIVDAFEASDFLAAVHYTPGGGPGTYTLPELAALSGRQAMRIHAIIRHMTELLPDIIHAEGKATIPNADLSSGSGGTILAADLYTFNTVILEPVRIAGRKPNEAELAEIARQKAERDHKRAQSRETYRAALIEADAGKTNLTLQDHATVTIMDKRYRLPLDSVPAIVAGRLFEALSMPAAYVRRNQVDRDKLRRQIWELMSLDERRLLSEKDEVVHGPATPPGIKKEIDRMLGKITYQLGITANIGGVHRRLVGIHELQVQYHAEPPTPGETSTIPVLHAPETPEHLLRTRNDAEPVSAEDIAYIQQTLETLRSVTARISHQEAIDILDFMMSSQGKYALHETLTRSGHAAQYKAKLESIHTMLRHTLGGSSYWLAMRERIIKGYSTKGSQSGVRQVSGGLPITTRWHIGVVSDRAKTWHDRFDS